tara:strand:- start:871 stop:1035 length:165 start_codon:yes stop_codon:yes gene_type:complete
MNKCPRCDKPTSTDKSNRHRPFCSAKCKLIDFGSWANEENVISRPVKSEDFYED